MVFRKVMGGIFLAFPSGGIYRRTQQIAVHIEQVGGRDIYLKDRQETTRLQSKPSLVGSIVGASLGAGDPARGARAAHLRTMHLLAPAKINLHLRVGRRRDDGFHPLLSWMCTVGLFDILTLEADPRAALSRQPGASAGEPSDAWLTGAGPAAGIGETEPAAAPFGNVELIIRGDDDRPDLPRDGRNLVVRIATAFVDAVRRERSSEREPADSRSAEPAFREEGFPEPGTSAADRAIAALETGSTASVGAASIDAPGMDGEGPWGSEDSRGSNRSAVAGPTGSGAGAVREMEGLGRSNRRHDAGAEKHERTGKTPGAALAAGDGTHRAAVRIALDKRVPIGAGLGGGSSDAAYTLVALNRLLASGWTAERLSSFAAGFGSDVPFFVGAALGSPSAACRGRGEVIRPVTAPTARRAVLFSPPFGLSTRDVYARFDSMGLGSDGALADAAEPDWLAWALLPAQELIRLLVNDLEPAAFSLCPDLAALRAKLEQSVGRVVRMSGSGSSLFTLFDADEDAAARDAARVGLEAGVASSVVEMTPPATLVR